MAYNPQQGRQQGGQNRAAQDKPDSGFINAWITKSIDKAYLDYAQRMAKTFADEKLTPTQFRNFYGELKRLESKNIDDTKEFMEKNSFLLLLPKLAYNVKRAAGSTKVAKSSFFEEVSKAHKLVVEVEANNEEFHKRFKNFNDFLEGILAYFKYYEKD